MAAKHTKKKTAEQNLVYKIETSKFGLFGIRLLVTLLTVLFIATLVVGSFMTNKASLTVWVLVPYACLAVPAIIIIYGMVALWQVKETVPKKAYGKTLRLPKGACVAAAVIEIIVLLCDFVMALFVVKEAKVKDELSFLLMCALGFIFAVLGYLIRLAIKTKEISQAAPPQTPPQAPPPPPAAAQFYPGDGGEVFDGRDGRA